MRVLMLGQASPGSTVTVPAAEVSGYVARIAAA
jgi:hypothetical protein